MAETDQTAVLDNLSESSGELTVEQAVAKYKEMQAGAKPAKQAPPEGETQEVLEADEAEGAEAAEQEPETTESESQPEDEEQAEPVTLELDDGTKITADEAVKGYLRQGDYSRRQQQLSQREKEVQAQITATLTNLEGLHKEVQALQPQEPNWLELKREYPEQWEDMRLQWEADGKRRAGVIEKLRTERQKAEEATQRAAWAELNSGTYQPKWRNPQALQADIGKIADWARNAGFTNQRINTTFEAADWIAWDKARRLDEIVAMANTGKKMMVGKPKPMKPQAKPRTSAAVPPVVVERFQKTRSIDDAVALYRAAKSASSKGASQRRH